MEQRASPKFISHFVCEVSFKCTLILLLQKLYTLSKHHIRSHTLFSGRAKKQCWGTVRAAPGMRPWLFPWLPADTLLLTEPLLLSPHWQDPSLEALQKACSLSLD